MAEIRVQNRLPITIAGVATVVAWLVWGFIVARTDPAAIGAAGFALFYLALFAAVSGTATMVGLALRRRDAPAHAVRIAVRQGFLLGLAVAIGVLLESRALLTWLNLLFLVLALSLLELFIISLHRPPAQHHAHA